MNNVSSPGDGSVVSHNEPVENNMPAPLVQQQSQELAHPPSQQQQPHQTTQVHESSVQHTTFNTPPPNYKMTPPPANAPQATLVMGHPPTQRPPSIQMMPPHGKGHVPPVNMQVQQPQISGMKVAPRAMPGNVLPQFQQQPPQTQMMPNANVPIHPSQFQSPPPLGPPATAHDIVHQPPPASIPSSGHYDQNMKQQASTLQMQQHQPPPMRANVNKPLLETPPPSITPIQQAPPMITPPMIPPVEHIKEQSPSPVVVDTSTPPPSVPANAATIIPVVTPPPSAALSKQSSPEPENQKGECYKIYFPLTKKN